MNSKTGAMDEDVAERFRLPTLSGADVFSERESVPLRLAVCALLLILSQPLHAEVTELPALGKIPVQEDGRVKPYSTLAIETLQTLTGRAKYQPQAVTDAAEKWSAQELLTAMWLEPERQWLREPMILVPHRPFRVATGLEAERQRFSYAELSGNGEFLNLFRQAQRKRAQNSEVKLDRLEQEAVSVAGRIALFERILEGQHVRMIPHPQHAAGEWLPLVEAQKYYPDESAFAQQFEELKETWASRDFQKANQLAVSLAEGLRRLAAPEYPSPEIIGIERLYYKLHPFRWAAVFYGLAALALVLTSLRARRAGYALGWTFAGAGFALQIVGFVCRILISGRPPVTNMYESVIWVAFGTVLFALIFEAIYRARYFLLAATPVAVISLILADTQPAILDSSIKPLVPVLRSNFWLTTHVLTITLSYAAFALALGVAHIILGKRLLGRKIGAPLYNYLYRTLQIGVLLLGTGTILGAVWANYSWGRFWDWDPKETWALIAFLCYIFVLHGRIAGYWGGFGLAVGAVIGFLAIIMAWYGVNFVLGAGLHSYGFGTGGFSVVAGIVIADLLFVATAIFFGAKRSARAWHGLPAHDVSASGAD